MRDSLGKKREGTMRAEGKEEGGGGPSVELFATSGSREVKIIKEGITLSIKRWRCRKFSVVTAA